MYEGAGTYQKLGYTFAARSPFFASFSKLSILSFFEYVICWLYALSF